MVSGAAPALTKVGFRRDVRLFLALLVGFLVALIFALILLLKRTVDDSRQTIWDARVAAASAATETFVRERPPRANMPTLFSALRVKYRIDVIQFRSGSDIVTSGPDGPGLHEVRRVVPGGALLFKYDPSPITSMERRFMMTAALSATAAIAGVLLLMMYVPRITRPIEQMLDDARELGDRGHLEESQFVVETFRSSIARLREQEEQLRVLHDAQKRRADELEVVTGTLTRSLSSGLLVLDRDGRMVEINSAGREILGVGEQRVSGLAVVDALGQTAFTEAVMRDFETRGARAREEILLEGSRVAGLTTVHLFDESGGYLGMLGLFADLTDVRRLESRLRELQTLADIGEMSAGIAHEFRNSLSTIRGYLALVRRGSSGEVESRIRRAEEEATVLSEAVDALLAFARPIKLVPQPVDLGDIAREVVRRLDDPPTGIGFTFDGEAATVEGDAVLLTRAVENIVRNAIDAVRAKGEGGTIALRTAAHPNPSLTVEDNGVGLDESDAPRLLLPFQSDKPSGMGLGLAIARKIVLVHGGSIALRGRKDEGASITIDLPVRAD